MSNKNESMLGSQGEGCGQQELSVHRVPWINAQDPGGTALGMVGAGQAGEVDYGGKPHSRQDFGLL